MSIFIIVLIYALWILVVFSAMDIQCRNGIINPTAREMFLTTCPIINIVYLVVLLLKYDDDFRNFFTSK